MSFIPIHRQIESVLDCRESQPTPLSAAPLGELNRQVPAAAVSSSTAPVACEVSVASVLDGLSAEEFTLLRWDTRRSYLAGTALWRCPCCLEPLYLATRSVAEARTLGGSRGYFKHHARARSSRPDCPLARDRGQHPDAIDAQRLSGLQEGAWHAATKEAIADAAMATPDVLAVFEETRVWSGEAWRQSDLLVTHELGAVAVEIQGVSPQIGTVMGREEFYGMLGIGIIWVVNAEDPSRLERQGFQDVAWPRGGVVFGWGPAAREASLGAGGLHLHRLALAVQDDRLEVEDCLVPLATAVAEVMAQVPPRPAVADDGLAEAYLEALLSGDEEAEQEAFEQLRIELGLTATWEQAWKDGLASAVAATVTALTGRKALASGFAPDAAAAILNNFLEARAHRPWVPLILSICEGHACADERLSRESTVRKIRTACAEAAADPARARQLRQRWGTVFRRLFPASIRLRG